MVAELGNVLEKVLIYFDKIMPEDRSASVV